MLTIGATLVVALIVPRLAGATPYVIETGSMEPGMPPGTFLVVKPTPVAEIASGDVLTYQIESGDPTVVTHRVIEQGVDMTGQPRWRTQGDANDVADENWVLPIQVKGTRWYSIPYLGYATQLVTQDQRQLITVLVVLGLVGYAGTMFRGAVKDRRRPTGAAEPAEAAEPVDVTS
jgi:signal peptidase